MPGVGRRGWNGGASVKLPSGQTMRPLALSYCAPLGIDKIWMLVMQLPEFGASIGVLTPRRAWQ
jgi:hypothetical protein